MLERKKILVTGGSGQLGSELRQLADQFPQFEFLFPSTDTFRIDQENAVFEFFSKHQPSYCVNCAAYTAVDKAETESGQAALVNGKAVGNLAAVCKSFGTYFIHISTDYVFDGNASSPYTEEARTNPQNVYGITKLQGEQEAMRQFAAVIIIRTSWVYSAFGKNFVKTMLRLMKEKPEINVVNDQFGSPTYAADLAAAVMVIISSGHWHPGIYHFSNAGVISWFDFAREIKALSGSKCDIHPIPASQYPTPAKRPAYSALSTEKISLTYTILPKPWKDRLADCLLKMPL